MKENNIDECCLLIDHNSIKKSEIFILKYCEFTVVPRFCASSIFVNIHTEKLLSIFNGIVVRNENENNVEIIMLEKYESSDIFDILSFFFNPLNIKITVLVIKREIGIDKKQI